MTFAFSDEQQELRRGLRRFLEDKSPSRQVRRLMETDEGYDPTVWSQMAQQLGLQGLTIPEKYGGAGDGPVEQIDRARGDGPRRSCARRTSRTAVLAVQALLASGDAAAQRAVPARHRRRNDHRDARRARGRRPLEHRPAADPGAADPATAYVLDGRKSFVIDGHIADLVLVVAQADGGPVAVRRDGRCARLCAPVAADHRHDPEAGGAGPRRRARPGSSAPQARRADVVETDAPARDRRARRRAGGRRAALPRHERRVREAARAVRPADRELPGDQAQVRRHAARGRVGEVGRVLRRVGRGRGLGRAAAGREPGQGLLLRGLLPRRRREHPGPRRHRLHLGARRAPVLPAGEVVGGDARQPDAPPRDRGHVPDRRRRPRRDDRGRSLQPRLPQQRRGGRLAAAERLEDLHRVAAAAEREDGVAEATAGRRERRRGSSRPASSNAAKASADSTSAHL